MSKIFKNQHYMNFGAKNECTAKRNDPLSSFVAADKASHTLNDDLRHVLKLVSENDGQTAGKIGEDGTVALYGGETIHEWNVADIKRQLNLPDKKMSKLVELGYVRVEERKGESNRNFITQLGREALK